MATLFDDASLVMIPSGYKDDKLYSIKPTDGDGDFTFSRDGSGASPATRVNSAGLIEKGRTNLLLQSNTFDTTWTNNNSTETSGQSGYDGTNNAWLLNSVGSGSAYVAQSVSSSGVKTLSVYAKAGTADWVIVQMAGGTASYAWFDLSSGVVGTSVQLINSEITSVGGGWYRCSITGTNSNTSVNIYISNADNSTSTSSGDNIYIQDAQLEKGLVATSVIETTTAAASDGILGDMPRLDYSGGASCPSLLLEPARTNLLTHSEYFGDSYWTKSASSITDNATTSPEGVLNAVKLVENTANTTHQVQHPAITIGNTNYASSSFYIKAGERSVAVVNLSNVTLSGNVWKFDLTAETATLVSVGTGWANQSASITSAGNGWYRCVVSGQLTSTATQVYTQIRLNNGTSNSYLGDGTSGFYLYGAQVEVGGYPTSYVPTYGSATARAKDFVYLTGASDLMNVNGSTILLEVKGISNGGDSRRFSISDGSYNNRVVIELDETADNIKVFLVGNGVVGASLTITSIDQTNNNKIAVAFDSSGVIVYINGEYKTQDTSITLPISLTDIKFRDGGGSNLEMEGYVKQTIVFPTRLSNAELATLTTL